MVPRVASAPTAAGHRCLHAGRPAGRHAGRLARPLGCPRSRPPTPPDAGSPSQSRRAAGLRGAARRLRVLRRHAGTRASFLEPDQSRPAGLRSRGRRELRGVLFAVHPRLCAALVARRQACLVDSDIEFRRALFNLRAADRPEVVLAGPGGRRGGQADRGRQRPRLAVVGGLARPGAAGRGGERQGRRLPHPPAQRPLGVLGARSATPNTPPPSSTASPPTLDTSGRPRPHRSACRRRRAIRGKVVDLASGLPVPGALIHAVRSADDRHRRWARATSGEDGSLRRRRPRGAALRAASVSKLRLAAAAREARRCRRPPSEVDAEAGAGQRHPRRGHRRRRRGRAQRHGGGGAGQRARRAQPAHRLDQRRRRALRPGSLPGRAPTTCGPGGATCWPIRPAASSCRDNQVVEVRIALSHKGGAGRSGAGRGRTRRRTGAGRESASSWSAARRCRSRATRWPRSTARGASC